MKQNYLIGMVLIAFGLYLMLVKLNVIIAFDFILLIALAFLGGYAYRRSTGERNAGGLLLVGNLLTGVYVSNHISGWLGGATIFSSLGTIFFLGVAFLLTWLIENSFEYANSTHQRAFKVIGTVMVLVGSYSVLLDFFNLSPSVVRAFIFPVILILIGVTILFKNTHHKIL